jgi:hypothetical protein
MYKLLAGGVPRLKTQSIKNDRLNGTFLTEENINQLMEMFKTKEDYIYYISSLWLIRDLIYVHLNDNKNHPAFPLFEVVNKFIGSLSQNGYNFDNVLNGYVMYKNEIIELQQF